MLDSAAVAAKGSATASATAAHRITARVSLRLMVPPWLRILRRHTSVTDGRPSLVVARGGGRQVARPPRRHGAAAVALSGGSVQQAEAAGNGGEQSGAGDAGPAGRAADRPLTVHDGQRADGLLG